MKFIVLLLLGVACAFARRTSWGKWEIGVANGTKAGKQTSSDIDGKPSRKSQSSLALVAEDPDVSEDYNQQTNVKLPDEIAGEGHRTLPFSLEAGIAAVWVIMIAFIPVILVKYSDKEVTTIHYVEGVLLIVWLVGGLVAFTQVILFQAAHWDGVRTLTMVESTYLLTQILTTIGYGDITPAMPRGQVVCAFYILMSVIIVGNMFSQVVEVIQKRVALNIERHQGELAIDEDESAVSERMGKRESKLREQAEGEAAPTTFAWVEEPTVDNYKVLKAFAVYALSAIVGILFFHLYPGEGKTLLQAIYMSIVTLSTVGFGAYTATTEIGKAFASFWMLIGVATLGHLVASCVEWSLQKKVVNSYCPNEDHISWKALIKDMDKRGDGLIDSNEFMKFALVHAGYATEEQIEKVAHFFRRMHPDKDGRVPLGEFEKLGAPETVRVTPRGASSTPRTPRTMKGF